MTIDHQDLDPRDEPPPATPSDHCDQFGCPFSDFPHAT